MSLNIQVQQQIICKDEQMNLVRKLARDSNYKMSLLIALGCFTGLRISDILALRWNQILDAENLPL